MKPSVFMFPFQVSTGAKPAAALAATGMQSHHQRGRSRILPVSWDAPMNYQQYLTFTTTSSVAVAGTFFADELFPNSGVSVDPAPSNVQLIVYKKLRAFVARLLDTGSPSALWPAGMVAPQVEVPSWLDMIDTGLLGHRYALFPSQRRASLDLFDNRRARLSTRSLLATLEPTFPRLARSWDVGRNVDEGWCRTLIWPSLGLPLGGRYFTSLHELESLLDAISADWTAWQQSLYRVCSGICGMRESQVRRSRADAASRYYHMRNHGSLSKFKPSEPLDIYWAGLRMPTEAPVIEDFTSLLMHWWALHTPCLPPAPYVRGEGRKSANYGPAYSLHVSVPLEEVHMARSFGATREPGSTNYAHDYNAEYRHAQNDESAAVLLGSDAALASVWSKGGLPMLLSDHGSYQLMMDVASSSSILAAELHEAMLRMGNRWQRIGQAVGVFTATQHPTTEWPRMARLMQHLLEKAGSSPRVLDGTITTWAPPSSSSPLARFAHMIVEAPTQDEQALEEHGVVLDDKEWADE